MIVGSDLSKLDAPAPRHLLRGLRREFANWYFLGPLSWIVLPSRCPPRGGLASLSRRQIAVEIRGGYRAECRIDEFFSFVEVFVLREYEISGIDWMSLQTIVDVGANVGSAMLWFAQKAPQASIIAVEPAPKVVPTLTRNVDANGLHDRVQIVAAALTGHTGTAELHQNGSSVFATTSDCAATSDSTSGESPKVPALSLQDLLDRYELTDVDMLKLDCEGAEFEVLNSSDDRVLRRNRHIVGEYHASSRSDLTRLLDRLEQAGFKVTTSGGVSLGLFQAVRT